MDRKYFANHILRIMLRSFPLIPAPELYDLLKDINRSRADIDEKISRAHESLVETSDLLGELEDTLKERTEKVNQLRHEYEKYSQLAEIEEGKAKALIEQLESSLGKDKNKERWIALLINLIAGLFLFVVGIILGPHVTNWLGINN